jgi:DNA-binding beta-propeller fold protein YncE
MRSEEVLMPHTLSTGHRLLAATVAAIALAGVTSRTQGDVQPVNDGPNPYQTILNWAKVPAPRTFGSTAGIFVDRDGRSIWAFDRCGDKPGGGFGGDGCGTTPDIAPVMKFDASGQMVTSFGAGMFSFPHGMYVDPDGNVWVTDQRPPSAQEIAKVPSSKDLGSRVVKFSPDGKVLMILGKGGVAGDPSAGLFTEPLDVVVGRNGDIFIPEGHCGQNAAAGADCVARISKFDRNGKFIKSWGRMGTGVGEFKTPHAIALDSKGRLVVADRGNHRLQIFDQDGKFLEEIRKFGRTSDIYIDRNDLVYAIDSESSSTNHPGWMKGVRVGSLHDDKIQFFVPGHKTENGQGTAGEGVTVDAAGNIYGAENGLHSVTKYAKN